MSIAGDHAHNDLWGIEAIAENKGLDKVELNTNEYSWRERLEKAGFKVDSTYEDIFVCGKSMQGGLDFGVFGVGIVVHIRVTVSHQENDVLLFGQFVFVVVVKHLCHFVRIIIDVLKGANLLSSSSFGQKSISP